MCINEIEVKVRTDLLGYSQDLIPDSDKRNFGTYEPPSEEFVQQGGKTRTTNYSKKSVMFIVTIV